MRSSGVPSWLLFTSYVLGMVAGNSWPCHTSRTLTKGWGSECMRSGKQKKKNIVREGWRESRDVETERVLERGGKKRNSRKGLG